MYEKRMHLSNVLFIMTRLTQMKGTTYYNKNFNKNNKTKTTSTRERMMQKKHTRGTEWFSTAFISRTDWVSDWFLLKRIAKFHSHRYSQSPASPNSNHGTWPPCALLHSCHSMHKSVEYAVTGVYFFCCCCIKSQCSYKFDQWHVAKFDLVFYTLFSHVFSLSREIKPEWKNQFNQLYMNRLCYGPDSCSAVIRNFFSHLNREHIVIVIGLHICVFFLIFN